MYRVLRSFRPLLHPLPLTVLSGTAIFFAASRFSTGPPHLASNRMSSPSPGMKSFPVKRYTSRHDAWPYALNDFQRQDPSSDASFYSSPRFVTHIDDHAISQLRKYYDQELPRRGRILDFCASWVSHYPAAIEDAVKNRNLVVIGMGMNKAELDANPVLRTEEARVLQDLNENAEIPVSMGKIGDGIVQDGLDAATCVVSIDYLTRPVAVLSTLRERMKAGGAVHLAISNRCFPTKAVSRWLRVDEQERLQMVGDYLHFAGWKKIEVVDLSGGNESNEQAPTSSFAALMRSMGMGGHDPLWIVRGVRED